MFVQGASRVGGGGRLTVYIVWRTIVHVCAVLGMYAYFLDRVSCPCRWVWMSRGLLQLPPVSTWFVWYCPPTTISSTCLRQPPSPALLASPRLGLLAHSCNTMLYTARGCWRGITREPRELGRAKASSHTGYCSFGETHHALLVVRR